MDLTTCSILKGGGPVNLRYSNGLKFIQYFLITHMFYIIEKHIPSSQPYAGFDVVMDEEV